MVLAEFSINEILSKIQYRSTTYLQRNEKVEIYGYKVRVGTLRLQTFKKNVKCKRCGREGNIFRLETNKGETPHLNFFHITMEGDEILMTRDHVIPLSKSGPNNIANSQTMCEPCNTLKADKIQKWYFTKDTYRVIDNFNLDV